MSCGADIDLTIRKGKTFSKVFRWGTEPLIYKAISAIPQLSPLRLTVTGHGVPDDWRIAISDVAGMKEVNAAHEPPRDSEYVRATYVDANTLEINSINAASFRSYVSGGVIRYYTPVNLTGFTAQLQIRAKPGGTLYFDLTSTPPAGLTIDVSACSITAVLTAVQTAAITWKKAQYELELTSPGSVVSSIASGYVYVKEELVTA